MIKWLIALLLLADLLLVWPAWSQVTQSIDLVQPTLTSQTWQDAAGNTFTLNGMPGPVKIGTLTVTVLPPVKTPVSLPDGTYNLTDPTHALAIDNGWVPIGLYAIVNDSGQKMIWVGNKLQCLVPTACSTAAAVKEAANGTAVLDPTGDTLKIDAVAGGFTILDTVSGHYLGSLGIVGAGKVTFGTVPFVWVPVAR